MRASAATLLAAAGLLSVSSVHAQSATIQRDPAAARALLNEVLALPVFKEEQDWIALLPSWLVPVALLAKVLVELLWNAMRWPFDRLVDLLTSVLGEVLRGPTVVALALIVIVGLVLLYQRGLRSAIVRQAEIEDESRSLPPTAHEALLLASREANAGRYREACHFVLLSTLLSIEERGHARFDPAATNREHLSKLAGLPPVARALEQVVTRFDRVWYGQESATNADYRELLVLADRVAEAAP